MDQETKKALKEIFQNELNPLLIGLRNEIEEIGKIYKSAHAASTVQLNIAPEALESMKHLDGKTPVKGIDYMTDEDVKQIAALATPQYGKDYATDEQIAEIVSRATPKKGIDYDDGEPGRTPIKGTDYFTADEVREFLKAATPVKGVHYHDGVGIKGDKGDSGAKISAEEIRTKLESLKGTGRLSAKAIKGLEEMFNDHLASKGYTPGKSSDGGIGGAGGSGGSSTPGATAFTSLTDVPSSYSSQALKAVRVNAAATGLEFFTLSGGGDALTASPLSQFAATTSLQLKGVISDETGSGALVFGTAPALSAPVITSGTITTSLVPTSNDGAALGSGTNQFSDLFLATGGVINWANGAVTLTHAASKLTFQGGSSGYQFDSLIAPNSNDGAPLGSTTLSWSDLFLASGAVINIAAGNWVATHSSGILTVSTGDLQITTMGSAANSVATKAYVDNYITGLQWKTAVRVATTTNGTLATAYENGDTIDGVVLATGDRILIKNQTTQTENGIYTVNASGAPTRATDADTGAEIVSATMFVREGTANSDTQWTCSNNTVTIGSTNITFAQVSGAGTYINGTGLSLTGNTFAIDATVATLTGAQVLTNKTLTAPVIGTIVNTGTLTLPTSTDTLVGKATTDAFTNKTMTSSTNVLGGVTMTLGSDANYDIYYRNSSGILTRLANGTTGQYLGANTGAAPSWQTPGGGGSSAWGSITGTLSSQTDLQSALDAKLDKTIAAYSFYANNTNASGSAVATTYQQFSELTYSGTTTWTGTTAPYGALTQTYSWERLGKWVTLRLTSYNATNGTSLTAVTFTLPTDCPNPLEPSGMGAADEVLASGTGFITTNRATEPTIAARAVLKVNAGDTGWDIKLLSSSVSARYATITIRYEAA